MQAYILKRIIYIIPTLLGILAVNFFLVQFTPGGPVEQLISRMNGGETNAMARITGSEADEIKTPDTSLDTSSHYRGAEGLSEELIREIEKQFGFDRPLHERFFSMVMRYACFDFGDSFFRHKKVVAIIAEKMPVSVSLGLWSTLLIYLFSIPLGIQKAVSHGTPFDVWTSFILVVTGSVPVFLVAVILITFFAGGNYLDWFPLGGLVSPEFDTLSFGGKIKDYVSHITLPVISMTLGGFAGLSMLTKNSFLDEIHKQYVITARAKGLTEKRILTGHVFRNAMLIIISGLPGTFLGIFFTGSMMIEVIFSLDGLGLLGFEATMQRDYPVMFATLYIGTLFGLAVKLISDLTYVLVDPRINFEGRGQQ